MSAHDQSQEVRRLNFAPGSHSLSLILPLSLYTVILRALPPRRDKNLPNLILAYLSLHSEWHLGDNGD